MLTDSFTNTRFIDSILKEEAEIIKGLQLEVVNDWGLEDDTGMLRQMLKGHFDISELGGGCRLTLCYIKYLRFLDMPWVSVRRKGMNLYNKIVFGRVYNDTSLRIRRAYQDALSGDLIQLLQESIKPLNIEE